MNYPNLSDFKQFGSKMVAKRANTPLLFQARPISPKFNASVRVGGDAMSLDTAVYYVLAFRRSMCGSATVSGSYSDVHQRLGRMMSPELHEEEIAEFREELKAREKARKRVMIGIAIAVGVLAVGWYFLTH
jgi:hypothetical protein